MASLFPYSVHQRVAYEKLSEEQKEEMRETFTEAIGKLGGGREVDFSSEDVFGEKILELYSETRPEQAVMRVYLKNQGKGLKICLHCHELGREMPRCSGCRWAHYCSGECSRAHWKAHKKLCRTLSCFRADRELLTLRAEFMGTIQGLSPSHALFRKHYGSSLPGGGKYWCVFPQEESPSDFVLFPVTAEEHGRLNAGRERPVGVAEKSLVFFGPMVGETYCALPEN